MPPSNAMENDKKRLRNQFTKDERTRLLAIMTEYGPLLDDKNISISSRKEIWEIIENKFNENGHSGRTSAQLKKYWQNYKYHSKRTKTIHKEVRKPLSPMTKQMVRMLAKVKPEEWAQYDFAVSTIPTKRSHTSPESSPTSTSSIRKHDRQSTEGSSSMSKTCTTPPEGSSKSVVEASLVSGSRPKPEELNTRCNVGGNGKISESNVVVSTTDVPGSSVMVSVICPEVPSKGRTVFWKPDIITDNIRPKLEQIYASAKLDDRVVEDRNPMNELSPDVGNSGTRNDLTGGPMNDSQLGKLSSSKSVRSAGKKSEVKKCGGCLVPKSTKGQTEVTASQEYRSGGIRNVGGVVQEKPRGSAWLSKDCDPMDTSGSVSTTDGRNATTKTPTGEGVPNPSANSKATSRDNRRFVKCIGAGKESMVNDPEFIGVLQNLSNAGESFKRTEVLNGIREMTEVFSKFGDYCNFEEDCVEGFDEDRGVDLTRFMMNRREDSSLQDLSCFELYLRLLRDVGQLEGGRNNEILRKIQPLVSMPSLTDTGKGNDGASSDSERGIEVDERTAAGSRAAGNLRVRRGSLMTPAADEDQAQREIKVEREVEPETSGTDPDAASAPNPPNGDPEDDGVMNTINYLVQAKLQSVKSESDHQLKLQTLEMEEKELRVKIAEMVIQETRLRIRALVEDRQRATEIHELRLAQMAAEKARFEAEHGSHVDASCTAAAKGRARVSSIERDRERSENMYQMQLRCMTAGAGANGNITANGGKCKPYQQ